MRSRLIAFFAKYAIKGILATCKIKIEGLDHIKDSAMKGPLIIMLWHNRLAPLAEILLPLAKKCRFAAFISNSRDGEILSQFVLSYKGGSVIRVPHTGRDKALKTMIETLKETKAIVLITPDGPRGPAYEMKPGILFAAQETNAQIIPFTWESKSYFELRTWDKFRLPKPFTQITARFGTSLTPTSTTTLDTLKQALSRVDFVQN